MGNEASLEGGEGPPSGLPEGLAPDGKGGFVRISDGTPVNLSELSEDERRQLAAAMSRAQGRQPGAPAAARRQGFQTASFSALQISKRTKRFVCERPEGVTACVCVVKKHALRRWRVTFTPISMPQIAQEAPVCF